MQNINIYSSFLPPVFNYASLVNLQGKGKVYKYNNELRLKTMEEKQKLKRTQFKIG